MKILSLGEKYFRARTCPLPFDRATELRAKCLRFVLREPDRPKRKSRNDCKADCKTWRPHRRRSRFFYCAWRIKYDPRAIVTRDRHHVFVDETRSVFKYSLKPVFPKAGDTVPPPSLGAIELSRGEGGNGSYKLDWGTLRYKSGQQVVSTSIRSI